MSKQISMRVFEIVGSEYCVASDDGQKVYEQIAIAIKTGQTINLSFIKVKSLTSAFLNTAIGQLYGSFSEEQIKKSLSISDMDQNDLLLLKRVVDTAKQYFKDPKRFEKQNKEALENSNAS